MALLDQLLKHVEGQASSSGAIQVLDAFQTPLILYDPIRKLFHRSHEPRALFADAKVGPLRPLLGARSRSPPSAAAARRRRSPPPAAPAAPQSKVQLYVDRFLLIQQRMRRNKMFRPPRWGALGGGARAEAAELTELKALLGLVGQRRYVVGFLTRTGEGEFAIEDLSARLPLDLSAAETAHGLFTENCVVVAEGELTPGGAFRAAALGLPPAEARAESLAALQGLDYFGGRRPDARAEARWRAAAAEDRVVVLSDVWLDRPEVVDTLRTVLGGYAALEAPPSVFVLMGNFQSYDATAPTARFAALRDAFAALGRLIASFPALRGRSRFVLVPGPGDAGGGGALPRAPLPRSLAGALLEAVPGAELASNPCRLRHGGAELVLFRGDVARRMRALALLPPGGGGAAPPEAPLFDQLCATVVQEAHLCPLPLEYQPVVWEHDHALYVYPMPHALVMADAEPAAAHVYDTCACANPVS